jgi:hypothetical protein
MFRSRCDICLSFSSAIVNCKALCCLLNCSNNNLVWLCFGYKWWEHRRRIGCSILYRIWGFHSGGYEEYHLPGLHGVISQKMILFIVYYSFTS